MWISPIMAYLYKSFALSVTNVFGHQSVNRRLQGSVSILG